MTTTSRRVALGDPNVTPPLAWDHNCPVAGPVWTPKELAAAKERADEYADWFTAGVAPIDGGRKNG